MKKLSKTTRNFNIICFGVMAMSVIMFAVGSLLR